MEAVNKLCNIETLLYPRCLEQSAYKKLACVTQYVCFVGNRMLLGLERERVFAWERERYSLSVLGVGQREIFVAYETMKRRQKPFGGYKNCSAMEPLQ